MLLLILAYLGGVLTIVSPCILPVLPIVLSGGVGGGKARPFGVLAGFVVSFTAFTLSLSAIVQAIGIPVDALRIVARGIEEVRRVRPALGILLVTHYRRILEELRPDRVHVMLEGRIVESGGPELAERLDREGYEDLRP